MLNTTPSYRLSQALLYSSRRVSTVTSKTHHRGMASNKTTTHSQVQGLLTTELTPPLIASVCAPIFDELKPRYPHLAWVGLFGSVSRGTQRPDSDVDILIGHDAAANFMIDVGGSMYELTESLPNILGREVDIVHFTKGTPMGYVQLEALLTSKTIWGDISIFSDDQAAAARILTDAYERVSKAARIYREDIVPELPSSSEDFVSKANQSQILSSVIEIIELLRFEHLHPFHHTTESSMAWIFEQEDAVRALMQVEEGMEDTTALHRLWSTLSDTFNRISFRALVQAAEQTSRRAEMNKRTSG